jgi:hypothetical protein
MMHSAHLTAHGFIGIGSHKALYPPAVVPVMAPHISMDTLLGLTLKAKYSKTVIGPFGFQFIGKGNDSGWVVPHIAIPPPSVLLLAVIPFGGSKPMFSSSKVLIDVDGEGLAMACACFPVVPLSLNQACNDPCNYPSDIVICPNTVVVGMTLGDVLAGLIGTVVDCAVSALANWIGGKVADHLVAAIAGPIASRMCRETVDGLAAMFGREAGESMGRDMVSNMLERPSVQVVQELVGKTMETIIGDAVGNPAGNAADAAGQALGAPSGASAPAPADSSGAGAPAAGGGDAGPTVYDAD